MSDIKTKTKELIETLQDSMEYVTYSELRDEVKRDPELRDRINKFRRKVYEVQNSNEPLDMYEEQEKLYKEAHEFRKNSLVNEYLRAELAMTRILQKVYSDILNSVDLDTDDVVEGIEKL